MTDKVNILTEAFSDTDPAGAVHAVIALRIAGLRKAAALSFDQLASRCGVSKGILVQIEQGRANPSIATLCRIASGLRVSVAELVAVSNPDRPSVRIVGPGEAAILWTGPSGGTARLLIGTHGPAMLEHWAWEMLPGERFESNAHPAGTQEMLHVLDGRLIFELDGTSHAIEAGGSALAQTDRDHAYVCPKDTPVRFIMAVYEPGSDR